jgi:putative tryptophan/tyrosine transport system substrate-binding protein
LERDILPLSSPNFGSGQMTIGIGRREFISALGGTAVTWPLAAHAQQPERMRRIGVLTNGANSDPEYKPRLAAFGQTLQQLGWVDGRNLRIEYRSANGDPDKVKSFARELVEMQPDVIFGASTPVIAALQRETRTIPIVFTTVSDPVGSGFVASLPKPGGNITGFINIEASLGGKWPELLKEIDPQLTRIAMIFNPETAADAGTYYGGPFETAAHSLLMEPIAAPVHNVAEIEGTLGSYGHEPGIGLVIMPDGFTNLHRELIISLAARYSVPAIYPFRYMVAEGGLMAYGVDLLDLYPRAASYVDRILKGEKPANLPVQLPTKFELVVNLKTAKALGMKIPESFLARADDVIE